MACYIEKWSRLVKEHILLTFLAYTDMPPRVDSVVLLLIEEPGVWERYHWVSQELGGQ